MLILVIPKAHIILIILIINLIIQLPYITIVYIHQKTIITSCKTCCRYHILQEIVMNRPLSILIQHMSLQLSQVEEPMGLTSSETLIMQQVLLGPQAFMQTTLMRSEI